MSDKDHRDEEGKNAGGRPEIEDLVDRHRALADRLAEFSARQWLTPDEQREEIEMKKKKLALKDRIAALSAAG